MAKKINNGDFARDLVSGFQGMVVADTTWLYGCRRLSIQPTGLDKDGQPIGNRTFDEPQLELIETASEHQKAKSKKTRSNGGPRPEPVQHEGPQ